MPIVPHDLEHPGSSRNAGGAGLGNRASTRRSKPLRDPQSIAAKATSMPTVAGTLDGQAEWEVRFGRAKWRREEESATEKRRIPENSHPERKRRAGFQSLLRMEPVETTKRAMRRSSDRCERRKWGEGPRRLPLPHITEVLLSEGIFGQSGLPGCARPSPRPAPREGEGEKARFCAVAAKSCDEDVEDNC
jgi:hypothetical protein